MLKKYNKMNDITKILIAMLLGSLLGILLGEKATCIGFIGTIWLNLMKMFLVPIVICMMVKGITSMDNPKTLGRIGIRIVVFYMFTTVAGDNRSVPSGCGFPVYRRQCGGCRDSGASYCG